MANWEWNSQPAVREQDYVRFDKKDAMITVLFSSLLQICEVHTNLCKVVAFRADDSEAVSDP
jgi:hypothetical protein